MSVKTSLYPVSKVIAQIILNSGYTPAGFLLALGYSSAEDGLPDLESWLGRGQGDPQTIGKIAAFDPGDADKLHKAVAETAVMKAKGVDPVALEKERIERTLFTPFIFAEGEVGPQRWTVIDIPAAIAELPLNERLTRLPELMGTFREQYKGGRPVFGKLMGFKFVCRHEWFDFDADGQLLKRVEGSFRLGGRLGGA
jgi:hypothetical protein